MEGMQKAMLQVYPSHFEATKPIFQRIQLHMDGQLPTKDSYRATLKRVIEAFHDAETAPTPELAEDAVVAATSMIDTNAK